MFDKKIS